MSKEIVIRLSSTAGRSRVLLPPTASLGDLQAKVQVATGVDAASQRLAFDDKGARTVSGSPSSSLASLNIVNGTQIYLLGSGATISAQVLKKVPVAVDQEKPVPAIGGASSASPANSLAVAPAPAAATTGGSSGSGGDGKDKGGGGIDSNTWSDKADRKAKFEVFDTFLRTRRYETSNLQGSHVHKSIIIKAGGMIKIPPSISIKQQPYRHVDQVSIYNDTEIQNFLSHWSYQLLPEAQQRQGWLYGYYLEDSNYGDKDYNEGTRVVVEGIYEPPQQMIGGECVMQADPDLPTVNRIAEALGLECVGHVFTSFPLDGDLLLSPHETQRIARLQNEHSTDTHFTKYRHSKFVSCAVRPDPEQDGNPGLNSFMVSDQCCALTRDGMLAEEVTATSLVVREGAVKNECMPTFLVEGKDNKHIPTDFFVIRLVDSQPKKRISLFTHADFPRENRPRNLQQRDDLKKYYRMRTSEPTWSRFADFHMLLYIAKAMDVDTVIPLCECVRDRKEISEGLKMLFESLMS